MLILGILLCEGSLKKKSKCLFELLVEYQDQEKPFPLIQNNNNDNDKEEKVVYGYNPGLRIVFEKFIQISCLILPEECK